MAFGCCEVEDGEEAEEDRLGGSRILTVEEDRGFKIDWSSDDLAWRSESWSGAGMQGSTGAASDRSVSDDAGVGCDDGERDGLS